MPAHPSDTPDPAALLRHMPAVQRQRQELRLVEGAWDTLSLLSSLSMLSSSAASGSSGSSASGDLGRVRQEFAALSEEMTRGLAGQALDDRLGDLGAKAQVSIDVLVRNLFERTADIGFFATDGEVARYLAEPEPEPEAEAGARPALEARLREYAAKYTVYRNIFLFDPAGGLRASLRPTNTVAADAARVSDQDAAFLRGVADSRQPYVEHHGVLGFCGTDEPTLVYAQRVLAGQQFVGVLCLEFQLADELAAIFASVRGTAPEGQDVLLAVTDAQGRVIGASDALQLPRGWRLPQAARAGTAVVTHLSRHYLMVARDTQGFQGYAGPGWRGVALVPLDLAFDGGTEHVLSPLMQEALANAEFLSGPLREIPRRSAAIQSALERSVWNGLLELHRLGTDTAAATPRELLFAKTLLAEIGATARKTAQAFAGALQDLYRVVVQAMLRDTRDRAALAMELLDRNLYERANDCRWWALAPQFAETLARGEAGCADASRVLAGINGLYTVYACLVLFDRQGRVMAVSQPAQAHHVGTVLDEPWVAQALRGADSQAYAVSDYAPSRFYEGGQPTFVYAAAVRAPQAAAGPVLGGIGIVWDAAGQLQSILGDCAAGMGGHDVLGFVDAAGGLLLAVGQAPLLQARQNVQDSRQAGDIAALGGQLYGVGQARGAGYREFRAADGYDHGLACLALRHLGARRELPAGATGAHAAPAPRRIDDEQRMQVATFTLGAHWLGVDAADVALAAPDAQVLSAGVGRPPFLGLAEVGARVYPVVELRSVIVSRGAAPAVTREADPQRQLVVLRIAGEDGAAREFALRVDALGVMLDIDRRDWQSVGAAGQNGNGAPLVDAVATVQAASAGAPAAMLMRVSAAWLRACAQGAAGAAQAFDPDLADMST